MAMAPSSSRGSHLIGADESRRTTITIGLLAADWSGLSCLAAVAFIALPAPNVEREPDPVDPPSLALLQRGHRRSKVVCGTCSPSSISFSWLAFFMKKYVAWLEPESWSEKAESAKSACPVGADGLAVCWNGLFVTPRGRAERPNRALLHVFFFQNFRPGAAILTPWRKKPSRQPTTCKAP